MKPKLFALTLAFAAFCVTPSAHAQKELEKGLIDLEIEGVPTYFTDLAVSPDGTRLAAAAIGGRLFMYDISTPGKATQLWASTKGGRLAFLDFSADGKYLSCRGYNSAMSGNSKFLGSAKSSRTDEMAVLDAATGNSIIQVPNGYNIQIVGTTAFCSTPDGFEWFALPTGQSTRRQAYSQHECASLTPDGKRVVVSYNPDKSEFKETNDANGNRKELRNAGKYKRQMRIYNVDDFSKIVFDTKDEVDIVYAMKPDPTGSYMYLVSSGMDWQDAGNGSAKVMERLDLNTGRMDKTFGIRTKDGYAGFRTNSDYLVSTDLGNAFGTRKQVLVRSHANTANVIADYEMKQKFASGGAAFTPVALMPGKTLAFVSYSKNIYLWDYSLLPHFRNQAIEGGEEAMKEKLHDQLEEALKPEGVLGKKLVKTPIDGVFTMDITVAEKGAVQTVFCESDELTNIPKQNALKDLVRTMRFDAEIPKGRRVKFRYVFEL